MSLEEKNVGNPLGTAPVGGLIRKFSIPAIISMLVSSLYNIVDQIFIGWGVGTLGNAATNIAFPITIICTATALLLGIGGASNYNLHSGAGKDEEASWFAANALSMLVICGTVIAAIILIFLDPLLVVFGVTDKILPFARDYTGITAWGIPFLILTTGGNHLIRADRSPKFSMTCMLTGAIINTILDPICIFVFHWGIKGAAAATVAGQVVSGLMVIYYFSKKRNMELRREMLAPKGSCIAPILSLGMASCVNQIAMAIVQIALNNSLKHYGANSVYGSEIPIACAGIISKVNMIFMAICIGTAQGCQPIWGFNYGAQKFERVRETYKIAFKILLGVGIFFFLMFQLFPRQIVSIFGTGTEEYFLFAERYLRIYMFMTFINGLHPLSSQFFTAIGKAKLGAIVSMTRQILFLLPLILIFPIFFGIDGIMYAAPIADFVAIIISLFFAWRELQIMKGQIQEREHASA